MAPGSGNFDFEKEIESLLSDQPRPDPASATDSIYRSGSAPPTVDRAGAALLFGPHRAAAAAAEEEFRAHPDYAKYYYSNLNPRLPHPAGSREDWRAAQRLAEGKLPLGGIGDGRRSGSGSGSGSSSSLFSVQPGLPARRDGAPLANNANGPIGMGARRNSFTQPLQKDTRQSAYASGHLSHPFSRSAFGNTIDTLGLSDAQLKQLHNDATVDGIFHGATSNGLVRVRSLGSTVPNSCESDPNSNSTMARSTTPDPKLIGGFSNPCLLPLEGRSGEVNKKSFSNGFDGGAPHMSDFNDMSVAFSGLKLADKRIENGHHHLQRDVADSSELSFNMPTDERHYVHQHIINGDRAESSIRGMPFVYSDFSSKAGVGDNTGLSTLISNGHANLPEQLSFSDSYKMAAASQNRFHRSTGNYQTDITSSDFLGGDTNPYSSNQGLPVMPNNQLDTGAILGSDSGQYFNRTANQVGSAFQVRGTERLFGQYLQETSDSLSLDPASLSLTSLGRNYLGPGLDSAVYPDPYLTQQKLHYNTPLSGKSGGYNNGFYNNHVFDLNVPYRSPLPSSFRSSLDPAMTPRQNELLSRFPSSARAATRGPKGPWNEVGMAVEGHASSLLEELKNNKTRSFELSEIVSYVVIFSTDQYGSRFIQQKLESASVEEKTKIFPEILPYAHGLMTDVFGNYVIQKFFEYGTESQRNQLADQLIGHVLSFSLQMYGCRVIQKALEVIDVDRQTQMVSELDGHIMKCVRDQNGNHVIQKCIECVAQERIQFIISSFYGQVVVLSTHPYGCRVIQRVLEHCDDEQTQSKMMEEILQSVTTLAQDQYGNYVIQHVLQHGKKEERSSIISKLSGLMVKMSLQKFASNVVEKCLTYGTREERQTLIDEILDSTNENEPLEAMMKDQFGNYVVQKILETCDDHIRELILSRIKVHFNSLKRYTYGKHIVARVEKLIATGERRIGMSSSNSS